MSILFTIIVNVFCVTVALRPGLLLLSTDYSEINEWRMNIVLAEIRFIFLSPVIRLKKYILEKLASTNMQHHYDFIKYQSHSEFVTVLVLYWENATQKSRVSGCCWLFCYQLTWPNPGYWPVMLPLSARLATNWPDSSGSTVVDQSQPKLKHYPAVTFTVSLELLILLVENNSASISREKLEDISI